MRTPKAQPFPPPEPGARPRVWILRRARTDARNYFNFRKGDKISRDRIGMHLPNIDAAREEAIYTWRDVLAIAAVAGEAPFDCEIQITDDSGETVLSIPTDHSVRLH